MKRYFINNIDSYLGQHLLKTLITDPDADPIHMCTFTDPLYNVKGPGIKKILKRHKPNLSRKKMLEECDVYVYDAEWASEDDLDFILQFLQETKFDEPRTVIFRSDVNVWAETEKKLFVKEIEQEQPEEVEGSKMDEPSEAPHISAEVSQASNAAGADDDDEQESRKQTSQEQSQASEPKPEYRPFRESDYLDRVPSQTALKMKEREDQFLALAMKENLKIIIVCSGILYGGGEICFRNFMKSAWLQDPEVLSYYGDGENILPTIHIEDLCQFIMRIADNPPDGNYVLATDGTFHTQKLLIQTISSNIGTGKIASIEVNQETEDYEPSFLIDLKIEANNLLRSLPDVENDFPWKAQLGLPGCIEETRKQFCENEGLRPLNILVIQNKSEDGEYLEGAQDALQQLSEEYRIPVLTSGDIVTAALDQLPDDDILKLDLLDEQENILNYLASDQSQTLNETLKVFYRLMKWRLSQNDCRNRGYILVNFPSFIEEGDYTFKKLTKRTLTRLITRPKPKILPAQAELNASSHENSKDTQEKEGEGSETHHDDTERSRSSGKTSNRSQEESGQASDHSDDDEHSKEKDDVEESRTEQKSNDSKSENEAQLSKEGEEVEGQEPEEEPIEEPEEEEEQTEE